MGWKRTSDPAEEPISVAEAKTHLRVEVPDDNALIKSLVTSAREYVEEWCERALINQTWTWKLDEFPDSADDVLRPPRPPLSSVTSITYIDTDGVSQTWAASKYDVDTSSEPGRIALAYNESWPSTRSDIDAVTVTYVAGYGTAGTSVPSAIRSAILLVASDLYEHREARAEGAGTRIEDNPTVYRLLWTYRVLQMV